MKRALASVPLNVSEGSYSRGKNRFARYHTAAGSMREVLSCTETAAAFGYIAPLGRVRDRVRVRVHVRERVRVRVRVALGWVRTLPPTRAARLA